MPGSSGRLSAAPSRRGSGGSAVRRRRGAPSPGSGRQGGVGRTPWMEGERQVRAQHSSMRPAANSSQACVRSAFSSGVSARRCASSAGQHALRRLAHGLQRHHAPSNSPPAQRPRSRSAAPRPSRQRVEAEVHVAHLHGVVLGQRRPLRLPRLVVAAGRIRTTWTWRRVCQMRPRRRQCGSGASSPLRHPPDAADHAGLAPFHLAFPVDTWLPHAASTARAGLPEGRSSNEWIDFDLFGHQIVATWRRGRGRTTTR